VTPATRCASTLKLVLDTNVVLDLVVFRDAGVEALDHTLQTGAATAFACQGTLEELRRVLAYPRLKLDEASQLRALEDFRKCVTLVDMPMAALSRDLPLCSDPDDQKFLELARHTGASLLITKDKALLRLARRMAALGGFSVVHPSAFSLDFTPAERARRQDTEAS
jgi:putative PIN family toxin of toxin-antitoxin system